jgi:hypothetical protein
MRKIGAPQLETVRPVVIQLSYFPLDFSGVAACHTGFCMCDVALQNSQRYL